MGARASAPTTASARAGGPRPCGCRATSPRGRPASRVRQRLLPEVAEAVPVAYRGWRRRRARRTSARRAGRTRRGRGGAPGVSVRGSLTSTCAPTAPPAGRSISVCSAATTAGTWRPVDRRGVPRRARGRRVGHLPRGAGALEAPADRAVAVLRRTRRGGRGSPGELCLAVRRRLGLRRQVGRHPGAHRPRARSRDVHQGARRRRDRAARRRRAHPDRRALAPRWPLRRRARRVRGCRGGARVDRRRGRRGLARTSAPAPPRWRRYIRNLAIAGEDACCLQVSGSAWIASAR